MIMKKILFLMIICAFARAAIVINSATVTEDRITDRSVLKDGDRMKGAFDAAGYPVIVRDARFPNTNQVTVVVYSETNNGANATYQAVPWAYNSFTNRYSNYDSRPVYVSDGFYYLFYNSNAAAYVIFDSNPDVGIGWDFTNVYGGTTVTGRYRANPGDGDVAGYLDYSVESADTNMFRMAVSNDVLTVNGVPLEYSGHNHSNDVIALEAYIEAVSNKFESNISSSGGAQINIDLLDEDTAIYSTNAVPMLYIDAGFDKAALGGIPSGSDQNRIQVFGGMTVKGGLTAEDQIKMTNGGVTATIVNVAGKLTLTIGE